MPMEAVVVVAISTLALVFAGSLTALVAICYHRLYRKDAHDQGLFSHLNQSQHDINSLIIGSKGRSTLDQMELDDVQIHPEIDRILSDPQWVDDATGLIPHCLSILKSCHQLTDRLVAATVSRLHRFTEPEQHKRLCEILTSAQSISPHVDHVVQSMYPPLDPRLLEARCTSLVLSVTQLSLVIRFLCHISHPWVQEATDELNHKINHLKVWVDQPMMSHEGCSQGNSGIINSGCDRHVGADGDGDETDSASSHRTMPSSPFPSTSMSMSCGSQDRAINLSTSP